MAAQRRRKILLSLLYEELFSDDLESLAFDAEKNSQIMFPAALDTLYIRRAQAPKVYGFVENVIPNYSELDLKKDFRINKTTFDLINNGANT